MTAENSPCIPKGSTILITGATSYVASYIIKAFLERGYRVCGIVRNLGKAAWIIEEVFSAFDSNGFFDLAEVPDMAAPNAFDAIISMRRPAVIIHVATIFTFNQDPGQVIPQNVSIINGLLNAAARQPSTKRFVYTSTIGTAFSPTGDIPSSITEDTWNKSALERAWAPPPYEPSRGPVVYAASKLEAERAMFKFVQDNKPSFTGISVNPFNVIGPALHKRYLEQSTAGWIHNAYRGQPGLFAAIPPACYVNVQDLATLHVAAALDPEISLKRLFAWAGPYNINMVLAVLRRQHPDHEFIADFPPQKLCPATSNNEPDVLRLLQRWGGRSHWIGLEQSVQEGTHEKWA